MLYCQYLNKGKERKTMKKVRFSPLKRRDRGQAMVEFVISLPILLFVIFGIIEFARMAFAWMAVQNAARFGVRYAVTGEFNDVIVLRPEITLAQSILMQMCLVVIHRTVLFQILI